MLSIHIFLTTLLLLLSLHNNQQQCYAYGYDGLGPSTTTDDNNDNNNNNNNNTDIDCIDIFGKNCTKDSDCCSGICGSNAGLRSCKAKRPEESREKRLCNGARGGDGGYKGGLRTESDCPPIPPTPPRTFSPTVSPVPTISPSTTTKSPIMTTPTTDSIPSSPITSPTAPSMPSSPSSPITSPTAPSMPVVAEEPTSPTNDNSEDNDNNKFDINKCNTYSKKWLSELFTSCTGVPPIDSSGCQCTSAKELIDNGTIQCNTITNDTKSTTGQNILCPNNCDVCNFCLYTIHGC